MRTMLNQSLIASHHSTLGTACQNQRIGVRGEFDSEHVNENPGIHLDPGYCLDAPERMPAGNTARRPHHPYQTMPAITWRP